MLLSQLIADAQEILDREGDLLVGSGLARCSYGEEVVSLEVVTAKQTEGADKVLVVDLILDETAFCDTLRPLD